MREKILVIRLGALGDLVLCLGAFSALRRHHANAEIALLTAPAFAEFARNMPYFDRVLTDSRPSAAQFGAWRALVREVRNFAPTRVYDLQGKTRQTILYALLGGPLQGPEWSGAAPLCAYPRPWPPEKKMHYTDFLAAQLRSAGVVMDKKPDLSWLDGPLDGIELPERFALFIPGSAPSRPAKRWPAEHYAALAERLAGQGIACLAAGTKADAQSIASLRARAPKVIDLSEKTSLGQLAALARRSHVVIGNDTGPTHLAASVGAKTIALMSEHVDPLWSAPRGEKTKWLQGAPLAALSPDEVWALYSIL